MSIDRKKKYGIAHSLMAKAKVAEHKEAMLEAYGTNSLKELTDAQLDDFIEHLSKLVQKSTPPSVQVSEKTKNLRSNVLRTASVYLGCAIGDKASWERFNSLLDNPRVAGKKMVEMDDKELVTLNNKLRTMIKKKVVLTDIETEIARLN